MHSAVSWFRIAVRLFVLFGPCLLLGLVQLATFAQPVNAEQSVRAPLEMNIAEKHSRAGNAADSLTRTGVISFYLPFISKVMAPYACAGIPGAVYNTVMPLPPPTDRPADQHADLNLAMRGYVVTGAHPGLVDYGGSTDAYPPKLHSLFLDNRIPYLPTLYRVYNWDWGCNCRGSLINDWPVTLAGFATTQGEEIRVPTRNWPEGIGWMPSGYGAMVLYATGSRITLKYTREDNVVYGYTIHIENICVDPVLLDLYNRMNAAGRSSLPALFEGQSFGRALTNELGVAIRDTGNFMDPRSEKDWWQ